VGTFFGVLGAACGRCKSVTTDPADIGPEHFLASINGRHHRRVSAASIFAKEYEAHRYKDMRMFEKDSGGDLLRLFSA
jgi:hypothetical protein